MTKLEKLYDIIKADATLANLASKGNDSGILTELQKVREDIDVPRGIVPCTDFDAQIDATERATLTAEQLQHLSVLLVGGTVDMQSPSIDVFANEILSNKPLSSQKIKNYKTKKGSVIDKEFGSLTLNDISNSLAVDRPDGKIK